MKVIAFNGSPRKDGNTSLLIKQVFKVLESHDIETELVQVGGHLLHGCSACYQCSVNKNGKCVQNDQINGWIER